MPCSDHLHSEIIIYLLNIYYWESILSKAVQLIEIKGVSGIEYKVHDVW